MSIVVVRSGEDIELDPSDERVICFDWDRVNLATGTQINTSTFTITVIKQIGGTALTKDNESRLTAAQATTALGRTVSTDNRATQLRVLATTATEGDKYELANKVVLNDTPAQTKEQSVRIVIRNR